MIEIQCHVVCKNKSVASNNRANGRKSKSFRKYLSNMPEKYDIKKLEKTVILGNAYILGEVLM